MLLLYSLQQIKICKIQRKILTQRNLCDKVTSTATKKSLLKLCTLKTSSTPHIRVAPERTEVANGCEVVVAAGNTLL